MRAQARAKTARSQLEAAVHRTIHPTLSPLYLRAHADDIATLDPPTEEELDLFRTEMDVFGQFSDASGTWIARQEDRWVMVGQEKP